MARPSKEYSAFTKLTDKLLARAQVVLFALTASIFAFQLQSPPRQRSQSESEIKRAEEPAAPDPRGTRTSPLIVQVQPAPKTDTETTEERRQRQQQAWEQRWTRGLAVITAVVGLVQVIAIGFQVRIAHRQNKIIERQNEIMAGQREAADAQSGYMRDGLAETRASISEATRSAAAMERIAESLATNVIQLKETLAISKDMAAVNKAALLAGHRAFLSIIETQFGNFGPGKSPTFVLQVRNVGRVPAAVTAWSLVLISQDVLPDSVSREMHWINYSVVIFPEQVATLEGQAGVPPFSPATWADVQSGALSLAVYGGIRYDAGFEITGETCFGVIYDPKNVRVEVHRRFHSTNMPGYNYAA
jgi:hypothetical protein